MIDELLDDGLEIPTDVYPDWLNWYRKQDSSDMKVIYHREKPVAFMMTKEHSDYVRIQCLHVNKDMRGRGIGVSLLKSLEDANEGREIRVNVKGDAVQRWFLGHQYIVRDIDTNIYTTGTKFIMNKHIPKKKNDAS